MLTKNGFVLDARGRKTGVILSLRRYARLLEDLHDLAVVAERRSEKYVPSASRTVTNGTPPVL